MYIIQYKDAVIKGMPWHLIARVYDSLELAQEALEEKSSELNKYQLVAYYRILECKPIDSTTNSLIQG